MGVKAKRKLTKEEQRNLELSIQDSVRQIKQLVELDEMWATLSIVDDCEPEAITDLLGIAPDKVTRKGDLVFAEGGLEIRSDCTVWELTSLGKIASKRPEEHLSWIIEQIFGHHSKLRRFQESGARTQIDLFLISSSPSQRLDLNPDVFSFLARYHLKVCVIMKHKNNHVLNHDD